MLQYIERKFRQDLVDIDQLVRDEKSLHNTTTTTNVIDSFRDEIQFSLQEAAEVVVDSILSRLIAEVAELLRR